MDRRIPRGIQHGAPRVNPQRGIAAMCASMALFIVNDALVKLVSERLPMDQIVFLRGLLATGAGLIWILAIQPRALAVLRHPGMARVVARAIVDVAATFTYLWALFNMPLPNTSAINLSGPLMVTVLAVLFFGEKVAWRRWSAIGVGAIGVLLVIQPSSTAFNWFSLVALVGTFLGAVRDIATRGIAREIPSILVTFTTTVAVAITGGLSVAVTGWTPIAAGDLALLAVASLFLVGAYHLIIVAMRIAETSLVAPFRYTAILWAMVVGYVVWGDVPNLVACAGIVILISSGLYLMHRERVTRRALRTP